MDKKDDSPFKPALDRIAKPYLEELFDLLIQEKIISQTPDIVNGLVSSTVEEAPEKSKLSDIDSRKVIEQLRDLQTVTQIVHNNTESDKTNLGGLINYIDFFNNKNVIDIPLSDNKIRALIGNMNNVNEQDIGEEWYSAVRKAGIDFREAALQLLEYFTRIKVGEVSESLGFTLDPKMSEYPKADLLITAKRNHSKLVLCDIKFRASIGDPKSIVLRGIEKWREYPLHFANASKYLIIIVYTNDQDHTFNRLTGQFHKLLIDRDADLLNRVFFMPVSLYKTEELQAKLLECYDAIQGLEISFDYGDSPLNHGWTGRLETLNKLNSIFRFLHDPSFGNVLNLSLPSSEGYHYIDYRLIANQKWKFRKVTFVLRPSDNYKVYVEVVVKGDNKRYWFQVLLGDAPPKEHSTNGTEYQISVPYSQNRDWSYVSVDVNYHFEQTFKTKGLVFQRIEGVRLRGNLTIAKILFD